MIKIKGKETEELYKVLKSKDLFVDYFHAGLSDFEKQKKQKNWTASNFQTLICTNAFGMGIDKSNVRLVIHASPSYSIENYYQEIGRAGRDGICPWMEVACPVRQQRRAERER